MDIPAIYHRMAELAFKKVSGQITDPEEKELTDIIESSPDNKKLFDEMMDRGYVARQLLIMDECDVDASWEKVKKASPPSPGKWGWIQYMLVAASVLVVAGVVTYFMLRAKDVKAPIVHNTENSSADNTVIKDSVATITGADGSKVVLGKGQLGIVGNIDGAPVQMVNDVLIVPNITSAGTKINALPGKTLQVQLSDGTTTWLSGNSELLFPEGFNVGKRTLELKGEGYFEVTKQNGVLFAVRTRGMDATVLGTSFTISSYDKRPVTTAVFTGKVQLRSPRGTIFVLPDEEAVFENNEFSKRRLLKISADKVEEKKRGFFIFEDKIKTILDEVASNYNCSIEYIGVVPDKEFSGSFSRNMPVDSLLINLSKSMLIDLTIHGNKIIADFTKSK